jgi:hypothetical protein
LDNPSKGVDWADENPAQKNDFQPLIIDHFYSGRSDIYVGNSGKSRQA